MAESNRKNNNLINQIRKTRELSTGSIYGTDQRFHSENEKDIKAIRNTIKDIKKNFTNSTGDNILEFYDRLNAEELKKSKGKEIKKKLVDIDKLTQEEGNPIINDIFFLEADRMNLYNSYKLIYDHIPQIAQALDTYVDNIISPDDFTKNVFNIFYNEVPIGGKNDDENTLKILKRLKDITDTYKIEDKATPIIRDTLKYGDQFVAVLPLDKEFNSILTESDSLYKLDNENISNRNILTKDDIILENEDLEKFLEANIINEVNKDTEDALRNQLVDMINNNVEYGNDYSSLLEDVNMFRKDFVHDQNSPFYNNVIHDGDRDNSGNLNINGSVVKILEPDRVIKLESNDVVYGYYYIEKVQDENFGKQLTKERSSSFSNLGLTGTAVPTDGISSDSSNAIDTSIKTKFIVDNFVSNISKKIDKKFIVKNKDFKYLIHNLLDQGYIINKKIRITYLSPDEVVHFKINSDGEYGNSIYKKILFTSKLYLAVLTSTLMAKLVRSQDHRAFYIEVGLDNDSENVVQTFVRDIKNKELKMADLKDINTVLSKPGQFNDYYIPIINGEKPIEIDTIQGMDAEINNEFMEYLLKAMVSGIGVPGSFINMSEDIEFMRSLAMQNGKFARAVIHFQKVFGIGFSEIYRKIYKHEYKFTEEGVYGSKKRKSKEEKNNLNKDNKNEEIQYDKLQVKFPSPASLNMTNLADQVNNSLSIIEFVVNTLVGETAEDIDRYTVKKNITKDLLPSIDWNKYEEIVKKAKMERTSKEIKTKLNEEPEESSGSDLSSMSTSEDIDDEDI